MLEFFRQHASSLTLAKARNDVPGLRRAQLGATHAICAHFTLSREPALVSMPTGTGKTAVLMMAPFFTEARRALVITLKMLLAQRQPARNRREFEFFLCQGVTKTGIARRGDFPSVISGARN